MGMLTRETQPALLRLQDLRLRAALVSLNPIERCGMLADI